ncbi:MAG: RNA polymerase sigma factor [Rubripirellula sp.]
MYSTINQAEIGNPSVSDAHLINAALLGEQSAFTSLVERYKERLFTAIRSDVGCSEIAEDIVQDAFIRAFMKLDTFRSESGFYTWLYRIALNSRRYYVRNRHRSMPLEDASEHCVQSWLEPESGPSELIERREECVAVRCALNRLDDHHRDILLLREFEGFDYRHIADALHLTMGTVRSRLSRARAQLRKELTGYWAAKPKDPKPRLRNEDWDEQPLSMLA